MDKKCTCDMRTSLVGDGCRYCNPQYYIDILDDQIKEGDQLVEEMAEAIHYHQCWDTMAYPTLADALSEVYASFRCSECDQEDTNATKP